MCISRGDTSLWRNWQRQQQIIKRSTTETNFKMPLLYYFFVVVFASDSAYISVNQMQNSIDSRNEYVYEMEKQKWIFAENASTAQKVRHKIRKNFDCPKRWIWFPTISKMRTRNAKVLNSTWNHQQIECSDLATRHSLPFILRPTK